MPQRQLAVDGSNPAALNPAGLTSHTTIPAAINASPAERKTKRRGAGLGRRGVFGFKGAKKALEEWETGGR